MAYYPSRSGSPLGHNIERTILGYTCTCGYNCWAIQQEAAQDRLDELLGRKISPPEFKLPDFDAKIKEQIEYCRRPIYQPTLEDMRRQEAGSKELCEISAARFKAKKQLLYYSRFV